jgi:hemerythrin-like domain-containing protein
MTFRATGLITKTSTPRISSGRKDKVPVSIGAQESNFANPLGLLADWHRRIERFLGVAAEARGGPLSAERRQAMETALRYFHRAAPLHTADEEEDLFPELRRVVKSDSAQIVARVSRLESEHGIATAWHHQVHDMGERWLRDNCLLLHEAVELRRVLTSLTELYRGHIAVEENEIFPLAKEALSASEKEAIGRRMAARRGARLIAGSPITEQVENEQSDSRIVVHRRRPVSRGLKNQRRP